MNKIICGLIGAAVGAAVSWFITKKTYEKKMDILVESTNQEVESMHNQLTELHRIFVTSQPTTVAISRQKQWDEIASAAKSTVGATYKPKTDEQVVDEFRANIEKAKEESTPAVDFEKYKEEATRYAPDEITQDEPKIFEITAEEYYNGDPGYFKNELDLYMLEEAVYGDCNDPDSTEPVAGLKGLIGMTEEELMDRIDIYYESDTEADKHDKDHLYFRNTNTSMDYELIVHREGNSPYYESIM